MRTSKFLISLLAVAVQAPAATIVYTDNHPPPLNVSNEQVVYLDAPDHWAVVRAARFARETLNA
ncbi:hypothetical protein WCT78_17285 [Pectobacterium versatile]|uniref:hypothetical protein n=1 Tax=Pectobacterium TaxID=122277 RepID=UPI000D4B695D|nr:MULTISPECIES: hypothetical protein [Pectobacterium]POY56467.1 hypothetical protein F018LOC_00402 [Pectobacterium versatile]